MIAALFALAAAMAIGGCAAVIQGFPYVRLESGLAMVIAGTVAASSGAVLFGLGVVAAGLRRVERAAGRSPAGYSDGVSEAPAALPPTPLAEGRPRLPPVLPPGTPVPVPADTVDPRAFEPSVDRPPFETNSDPERARIESSLFARDHHPTAAPPEPELPIPGLTPAQPAPVREPETASAPEPAHDIAAEDDLFAAPGTDPGTGDAAEAPPSLRPSLDAMPDPEPEKPEPEKLGLGKPERTVVGRYASGGNTYVMFEDGTIEAETPQGRFTFSSLDELKAFVEGGGEAGTRGAA